VSAVQVACHAASSLIAALDRKTVRVYERDSGTCVAALRLS
jgi:hypothetical protein